MRGSKKRIKEIKNIKENLLKNNIKSHMLHTSLWRNQMKRRKVRIGKAEAIESKTDHLIQVKAEGKGLMKSLTNSNLIEIMNNNLTKVKNSHFLRKRVLIIDILQTMKVKNISIHLKKSIPHMISILFIKNKTHLIRLMTGIHH